MWRDLLKRLRLGLNIHVIRADLHPVWQQALKYLREHSNSILHSKSPQDIRTFMQNWFYRMRLKYEKKRHIFDSNLQAMIMSTRMYKSHPGVRMATHHFYLEYNMYMLSDYSSNFSMPTLAPMAPDSAEATPGTENTQIEEQAETKIEQSPMQTEDNNEMVAEVLVIAFQQVLQSYVGRVLPPSLSQQSINQPAVNASPVVTLSSVSETINLVESVDRQYDKMMLEYFNETNNDV
jgi:hypothetical protein